MVLRPEDRERTGHRPTTTTRNIVIRSRKTMMKSMTRIVFEQRSQQSDTIAEQAGRQPRSARSTAASAKINSRCRHWRAPARKPPLSTGSPSQPESVRAAASRRRQKLSETMNTRSRTQPTAVVFATPNGTPATSQPQRRRAISSVQDIARVKRDHIYALPRTFPSCQPTTDIKERELERHDPPGSQDVVVHLCVPLPVNPRHREKDGERQTRRGKPAEPGGHFPLAHSS